MSEAKTDTLLNQSLAEDTELDSDSELNSEFERMKSSKNTDSPVSSETRKSPKSIPKGVDFGHDLISNGRYVLKASNPPKPKQKEQPKIFKTATPTLPTKTKDTTSKSENTFSKKINNIKTELESVEASDSYFSDSDMSEPRSSSENRSFDSESESEKYERNLKEKMKSNNVFSSYNQLTEHEIYERKEYLLIELDKLEEKGVKLEKKYTIQDDISDIERAHTRMKRKREQEIAIKLMRKILMGFVTGTEYVNQKFNADNIDLEGWSESVLLNISDYDEIFEELYDKYNTRFAVSPEIKLLITLFGSAFTFHMTKVLTSGFNVKQTPIPQRSTSTKTSSTPMSHFANLFSQPSQPNKSNKNDELDEIINEIDKSRGLAIPDDDELDEIISNVSKRSKGAKYYNEIDDLSEEIDEPKSIRL